MPLVSLPDYRSTCLFIRPSVVCYQNCEHDISKTDELILLQIGTTVDPLGYGMKRSTSGVSRRPKLWMTGRSISLDHLWLSSFSSFHEHLSA